MKKIVAAAFLSIIAASAAAQNDPIVTQSTNNNTNTSTSTSTNTNTNINHTTGEMTNRNITESRQTLKQPPPTAVAPAVTTINNDVCAVVASGAVQTQIFGISMGGTMRDMNCERIKLSKNLFDMGMKVAAVATLCQDERVFAAMIAAGTPCPVDGKIGAQAREEWERRGAATNLDKKTLGNYALTPVAALAQPAARPEPAVQTNTSKCDYTGDDPVIMARVCGR
jgi:hypothetical protein